ncbi:MAG: hypothetical protein JOS17DRAFT_374845, partial [Linnemannia elongata]
EGRSNSRLLWNRPFPHSWLHGHKGPFIVFFLFLCIDLHSFFSSLQFTYSLCFTTCTSLYSSLLPFHKYSNYPSYSHISNFEKKHIHFHYQQAYIPLLPSSSLLYTPTNTKMVYKAPPAPWRQWLALLSTLLALILFAPSGATAIAELKAKQDNASEGTATPAPGVAEAAANSSFNPSRESEHVATVDTKRGLDGPGQQQQQQLEPQQPSAIVDSASSPEPIVL